MDLLAEISSGLKSFVWSIVRNGHWFALFAFFFPLAFDRLIQAKRPDDLFRILGVMASVSLIPLVSAGWWLIKIALPGKSLFEVIPVEIMIYYFFVFGLSVAIGFIYLREVSGLLDKLKARATKRTSLERNRKTDVREIHKFLPSAAPDFDPRNFYNLKKGIFFGLNEQRRPVYLPYQDLRNQHLLSTGRTRAGKGVAAQIVIPQFVRLDEYSVILDPKRDAHMPYVLFAACQQAGVPFNYVDVNQSAPPQLNPFFGADAETNENVLIGGFSLTEKGEAADFYRLNDRKAARRCAAWLAQNPGATARDAGAKFGDAWAEEAKAFGEYMREMAELDSVCAGSGGLDIAEGAKRGGVLYVVGDMMNPRILRVQRMILLRLLFLAKQNAHIQNKRTIFVFADEFKTHISRPFMLALGAAAGWGLHTMLAFQSLQDLHDSPADLDARAVAGAVLENCAVRLSYSIMDPDTAEWLSRSTGTILVDDEMRRVGRNLALSETVSGERSIRQSERAYIDTNMFQNLPRGCGVLSVPGTLPRFVYTAPPRVPRDARAVQVTPARGASPAGGRTQQPAAGDPLL